jgi:hypothetical protein
MSYSLHRREVIVVTVAFLAKPQTFIKFKITATCGIQVGYRFALFITVEIH